MLDRSQTPLGVPVPRSCQDRHMQTRQLGDTTVGAIGLGAMQLDDPPERLERAEPTMRAALDAGVTLIDTAIAYGPSTLCAGIMGANERLVASLLDRLGVKDKVLVATKGGHTRDAHGLGGRHSAFEQVGAELGVSPQRVCLAWMLAKSPVVIPIPGASRPESITDSAAAADLELTPDQLARLDA